jgi:hypothetical protein
MSLKMRIMASLVSSANARKVRTPCPIAHSHSMRNNSVPTPRPCQASTTVTATSATSGWPFTRM